MDTFTIIENTLYLPQGITVQNKTNLLYVGSSYGRIDVLNIKTLNTVKQIKFYNTENTKMLHDVDILSLKMVWDTLYIYAFEDWHASGGIDRIFTIDNVNNIEEKDEKKKLTYSSCELSSDCFSKYIECNGNYLYISSWSEGGVLIYDRTKKKIIKRADAMAIDLKICNNIFKIEDEYLIICRFNSHPIRRNRKTGHFYSDNYTESSLEMFDLKRNPLLKEVDYEYRFINKRIVNIKILNNKLCIQYLRNENIVSEEISLNR